LKFLFLTAFVKVSVEQVSVFTMFLTQTKWLQATLLAIIQVQNNESQCLGWPDVVEASVETLLCLSAKFSPSSKHKTFVE